MTLQSSASAGDPLKFSEIQSEFSPQGSASNFRAYLKNAGIVDSVNDVAPNVPTSGTMNILNFLSAQCVTFSAFTQTITSGSGTVTAPAGATSVVIEVWGAGGGGSRGRYILAGGPRPYDEDIPGSGGGGGGYAAHNGTGLTVTGGVTFSYTVGTGGIGGQEDGGPSAVGANGGMSQVTGDGFNPGLDIRGNGGQGGASVGGSGGTGTGGTTNTTGTAGTTGGAGGAGANGGAGGAFVSGAVGGNGSAAGGGGGGGGTDSAPTGYAGGDGARGEIRFSWS